MNFAERCLKNCFGDCFEASVKDKKLFFMYLHRRWKESILSLPKKWMSQSGTTDEYGFPEALPKLPLPPLEETMVEYLRILEPITSKQQHDRTKTFVKQFLSALGPKLQEFLEQKRDTEDNWAYSYWLNDMYLDNPIGLPINSNPGMVLPPRKFNTIHDLTRFASKLVDLIMQHKELLDAGGLPLERCTSREKGQPMCMAQFYRLLGSCRQPGIPRDSQYLPEPRSDEHIIVIHKNKMYCLAIKAPDRGRISEDEIYSQLSYILNDATCEDYPMIGILSSQSRHAWARDRAALLEIGNRRNFELIEQALFMLCLDDPLPGAFNTHGFNGSPSSHHFVGGRDETNMVHQMIHGGGSKLNSGNRWFDKTVEIIITTDGTWGLCYEHSPSEGLAPVQLLEGILKNIDEDQNINQLSREQNHLPPPEKLEWVFDDNIIQRINVASQGIDKAIEDLDLFVYRYRGYGKNFIKSCQVSPDVYIQLALQLAYFKLYGQLVSTYESASTRRFLLGRVDCIRSASSEALEWVRAINQDEAPNVSLEVVEDLDSRETKKVSFTIYNKNQVQDLFRTAVQRQTEVMVKNILGKGVDIPLLGLREACKEVEGNLHEIFTDESYKIANCFLLSTSQVPCSSNSFMGYGPVTLKGYGCSYNPHPNEIIFCISSFFSSENTSSARFAKSLQDSLYMMKDLLEN